MSEEFEPRIYSIPQVAEVSQPLEFQEKKQGHFRLALAGIGMAALAIAGMNTEAANAETTTVTSTIPSTNYESMSFSEKADTIEAAGHRGLKGWYKGGYAEEDSVRSCLHAFAAGADACEIDGRTTKDGVPIIMHDATTGRTTRGANCNISVATHTWNRIRKCRLNGGDRIPKVARMAHELSPYASSKKIVYEFKEKNVPLSVVRKVNAIFAQNGFGPQNLSYESFYARNLNKAKRVAPNTTRYLINGSTTNPPQVNNLDRSVVDGVIIPYAGMVHGLRSNPNYVDNFRKAGMLIMPWNVETTDQMRYVINSNATGLISDDVNRMKTIRN